MAHGITLRRLAVLLHLLLVLTPCSLTAQLGPGSDSGSGGDLWLEARAGTAFTMGDLADFSERGGAWGAGVAYGVAPRLRLRADVHAAYLPGADWDNLKALPGGGIVDEGAPDKGPATDLVHVIGSAQVRLNEAGSRWAIRAHAGAGVTFLSAERTAVTEGGDFERFTLDGGVTLGWELAPRVRLLGRGDLFLMLSRDTGPSHLGKELTLPFTAGVAVGL